MFLFIWWQRCGACVWTSPTPGFHPNFDAHTHTHAHALTHSCDCRGLVKNKNNNKSKKCVLISVSCSCQIILPHFLCTKPNRMRKSPPFRKSHFTRRITEHSKILSVNSGHTFARHCLMDRANTLRISVCNKSAY